MLIPNSGLPLPVAHSLPVTEFSSRPVSRKRDARLSVVSPSLLPRQVCPGSASRRLRRQPPARLTVEQAAWVINCQSHGIPILVAACLLKPLGNPAANGIRFLATPELQEIARDRSWLVKVTNAVNQPRHRQNAQNKNGLANSLTLS